MTAYLKPAADEGLNPQLADLISEALVWSETPEDRARVFLQIVRCAVDAVYWRLLPDGDPHEELSAQRIMSAAVEHLERMQT